MKNEKHTDTTFVLIKDILSSFIRVHLICLCILNTVKS